MPRDTPNAEVRTEHAMTACMHGAGSWYLAQSTRRVSTAERFKARWKHTVRSWMLSRQNYALDLCERLSVCALAVYMGVV